ncbi:MAG: YhgE/Pip domain-containing protein [Rhodoferax sp.]|nr:YhgE/Pip domain-containing protein [Rhodoferax sp.]
MSWVTQTVHLLRLEVQFFLRFPKLIAAALLVVFIPALYTFIYLSSVWDPMSRIHNLPVGLVNLDQGMEYRGQMVNTGAEVVRVLHSNASFAFQDMGSEAAAREQVRLGALAFALVIPPDFSSNAIPGQDAGGGKLVVYTSEGNNLESALLARNFARQLGHDVNVRLNERRWGLVLQSAAGSQRNVDALRDAVEQLRSGAQELSKGMAPLTQGARQAATGSARINSGVDQLLSGVRQLGTGLHSMDAKRPRGSDLDRLKSGAEQLAAGHVELSKGLGELKTGSQNLHSNTGVFRDQAQDSFLVPAKVGENLDLLYAGTGQLNNGLQSAVEAQARLAEGAQTLGTGVTTLTNGVRSLNQGLRNMVNALPEDRQLDELVRGTNALVSANNALTEGTQAARQGAERLRVGLDGLAASLPPAVDKPEGSSSGLANSVSPVLEVGAPVANSGSGFAANIIPAALWLGAGVAAFLIHVRQLARQALHFAAPAKLLGKLSLPLLIVLLQAATVYATAELVLDIHLARPALFALTLGLSATTFLCIVMALTRVLGDAGKALAMIFLAVQLSSSGGIMPVELSGTLYSEISPWLPLTWVVRAMKVSMFDAYGGDWQHPLLVIASTCLLALISACWVGRWHYVRTAGMRPAVDF